MTESTGNIEVDFEEMKMLLAALFEGEPTETKEERERRYALKKKIGEEMERVAGIWQQ